MLVKIGNEFYTSKSENKPIMIIFTEDDVKQILNNYNNPEWQRKILNCPAGYFKDNDEKIKYMDDIVEDNQNYLGYNNLIGVEINDNNAN